MISHQSKNEDLRLIRNKALQKNDIKHIIKQSQTYMRSLSDNLGSYEPFNNKVTPDDCVDRLVVHRIVSKFHIDDPERSSALQSEAFSTYIDYDNNLSEEINLWDSYDLRAARVLLHKWFKGFSVDNASIRYSVSPGETYISSQGEVSILSKLFNKNHWTTTANCLHDTCVFIYNNISFKRAAKQHIGAITRKEKRKLYSRFRNCTDIGFEVFKYLLIDRVLILVDGARASSVPKSNDKRRFINVEAMFPVILQRAISAEILRVLKREGNDMDNFVNKIVDTSSPFFGGGRSAQSLHGDMISSGRFSTIDFSNASDSVTIAAVCALFPKQVVGLLLKARSHYVVIDGELHSPKKLSSMGNGFTFEVMTVMLYAIASVMSNECRVYGDDVIIPNEFASRFVSACELIDFRINKNKTFINSFFRESCGYFYSDHHGYLTSFDFGQILSLSDVIITCNKLTVIIESRQISDGLSLKLIHTRDKLNALAHASRKGPLPSSDYEQRKYLSSFIFDTGYRKKQSRSSDLRTLRQHYIEKNSAWFNDCQIEKSDYSLVYVPFFVPQSSKHLFTGTKGLDILLPALYSGKRLKAVTKGKGKWIDLPAFVCSDGTLTLLSNLISSSEIWKDRLNGVLMNHERK